MLGKAIALSEFALVEDRFPDRTKLLGKSPDANGCKAALVSFR